MEILSFARASKVLNQIPELANTDERLMALPPPPPDIFAEIAVCQAEGRGAVLAIIVATHGSTPQKAGAKLLLRDDGVTVGTVGGGELEARVLQAASQVLESGAPRLLDLELTPAQEALCGGRVSVYLEPLDRAPQLYIVGAGHVGQALAALGGFIGFQVMLFDDRPLDLPPELGHIPVRLITTYKNPFDQVPLTGQVYIVIASRGHQYDFEALVAALATPAVYIGLLGSTRKKTAMAQKLTAMGFTPADLARVFTPVGLDLGAVSPAEIAVSIAAQLIRQRRNHAPADFSSSVGRRLFHPDGAAESPPAPTRQGRHPALSDATPARRGQ